MRRLLSLILLAALATILASPFAGAAEGAGGMACCRDGAKMICCAPSAGCQMKSCPNSDRATMLPSLEPAVPVSTSYEIDRVLCPDPLVPLRAAAATLPAPPPDQPPRF